jgi:hypothetical protein
MLSVSSLSKPYILLFSVVVVISFEEYRKMIEPKVDFIHFLRNSPLTETNLGTYPEISPSQVRKRKTASHCY